MERLRANMHTMMKQGGEEAKLFEEQNQQLTKDFEIVMIKINFIQTQVF